MLLESVIAQVSEQQKSRLLQRDQGLKRDFTPALRSLASHALIISGVRRCGKSTLLMQLMKGMDAGSSFYMNFDSPRLYDFALTDFVRLDHVIAQRNAGLLFFDEIQLVDGWEMYVRQKLDEGFRVIITGSNASLLSKELGTRLTGRHITQELFPFSYREFLSFRHTTSSAENVTAYLDTGGFPEYLKTGDQDQLAALFEDVLVRDIVARYGIKDIKSLHRLASYLASNTGNRITATKLKQPLAIGATSTVLAWFSHLELSYLFSFLPVFSHSVKARLINPRKVYGIDPGLTDAVSNTLTKDLGRKLENIVFLQLRRKYAANELFYFDVRGECDFVAVKNGMAELVQVCYELTPDNLDRELNGLFEAMRFFDQKKGTIITFDDSDAFERDGLHVDVIPAWKWLMEPGT